MKYVSCLTLLLSAVLTQSVIADPAECLKCHTVEEFKGLDAAAIREVLADPGIPPHRRFAELTEAQVAEILEALE